MEALTFSPSRLSGCPIVQLAVWRNQARAFVVGVRHTKHADKQASLTSKHPHVGLKFAGPPVLFWRRRAESNCCTGLCRPLPKPLGHAANASPVSVSVFHTIAQNMDMAV